VLISGEVHIFFYVIIVQHKETNVWRNFRKFVIVITLNEIVAAETNFQFQDLRFSSHYLIVAERDLSHVESFTLVTLSLPSIVGQEAHQVGYIKS